MRSQTDEGDALFRAAFRANPIGSALVERDAGGTHRVIEANPSLGRVFERPHTQLIGVAVDVLLETTEPDNGFYGDGWREQQRPGTDHQPVWIRWNLARLPVSEGNPPRYLLHVDVATQRVEARRQAQRQARVLDLIPEPVIIRALDGTIVYWNKGATEIYGYSADEAIGRPTHDLLQTRFLDTTLCGLEEQLLHVGTWRGQLEHRHADGHLLRVASKHVRDDHGDGEPVILEVNVDITERVAAEEALAASEAKFRAQFANSTVGQLIRRVDGIIEEVNPAMAGMLGYEIDELIGTSADRIFSPAVTPTRDNAIEALLSGKIEAISGEATLVRADGSLLDAEVNVSLGRGRDGAVERFIGIYQDITARKIVERTLTYQASHDPLTGLGNRTLLLDRITEALTAARNAEARDSERIVGLVYLDLDGFKAVNDDYGHHTGDVLLTEVAHRLMECVRGGDTVARLGGDEFVVLCPDLDARGRLPAVAERVLSRLSAPYLISGRYIDSVTASVGISYPTARTDPSRALRDADRAMYEVKKSGKNRIGLHVAGEADRRSA